MRKTVLSAALAAAMIASGNLSASQPVTAVQTMAGMAGYYQITPSGEIYLYPKQVMSGMSGMSGMGGMSGMSGMGGMGGMSGMSGMGGMSGMQGMGGMSGMSGMGGMSGMQGMSGMAADRPWWRFWK
jgi:hypothetical protein